MYKFENKTVNTGIFDVDALFPGTFRKSRVRSSHSSFLDCFFKALPLAGGRLARLYAALTETIFFFISVTVNIKRKIILLMKKGVRYFLHVSL